MEKDKDNKTNQFDMLRPISIEDGYYDEQTHSIHAS